MQGRWEWMQPGIDALARRGRVITFSLADEPTADATFDQTAGFWSYVEQVREAMDQSRLSRAAICGVSYGGPIAAAFAVRYPARVASLIMASALPPSWRPDRRVSSYLRHPWLMTPLFCVGSLRFFREIAAAHDTWWSGMTSAWRAGITVLGHMFHPGRMARRVHLLSSLRIDGELPRVKVPTLVITGEESLERVVPPALTREYVRIWPHARVETLARTGHLGMITRPDEFAAVVSQFAAESMKRIA